MSRVEGVLNNKMDARYQVILSQIMQPFHANPGGTIHGGEVMKLMDNAAGAAAMKYTNKYCVTVRVDELVFKKPVYVGSLAMCTASIVYVGKTSMDVYVTVATEDLESSGEPQVVQSAYFTLVCIGREGKPQRVPPFLPETEDELKHYKDVKQRRKIRENKSIM